MRTAGRQSQNPQTYKQSVRGVLGNESGASLVAAILFFVLCGVGASVILAAASASAGKMKKVPEADQKRFAVESAAGFLRDEIFPPGKGLTLTITDVEVDDTSLSDDENPTYSLEYVWKFGLDGAAEAARGTESILGTCVEQIYDSLEEQNSDTTQKQSAQNTETQENAEKTFDLSVKTTKNNSVTQLGQLETAVQFSMDSEYQITAVITDKQTEQERKEDRCERLLTVPAKVAETETVDVEDYEETDEEGNVTDEWTVTTTTRITTITWERGVIERTHPKTETTGE